MKLDPAIVDREDRTITSNRCVLSIQTLATGRKEDPLRKGAGVYIYPLKIFRTLGQRRFRLVAGNQQGVGNVKAGVPRDHLNFSLQLTLVYTPGGTIQDPREPH